MERLPDLPIATDDSQRALGLANLSLGSAGVLGLMSAVGTLLFASLSSQYPSTMLLAVAFGLCGLGAVPLAVVGLLARRAAKHGGRQTWREDRAARAAARERLDREPWPHEILRESLHRQKNTTGMRPETIRRYLEARGTVMAEDLEEREFLRELLVYSVKLSRDVKGAMRDGDVGSRDQVELVGHAYEPLDLDVVIRDCTRLLTETLQTPTPAPVRRTIRQ